MDSNTININLSRTQPIIVSKHLPNIYLCSNLKRLQLAGLNVSRLFNASSDKAALDFGSKLQELVIVNCKVNKSAGMFSGLADLMKKQPANQMRALWISPAENSEIVASNEKTSISAVQKRVREQAILTGQSTENVCCTGIPAEKSAIVKLPQQHLLAISKSQANLVKREAKQKKVKNTD